MRKLLTLLLTGSLALLLLGATACGGDDDDAQDSDASATATADETDGGDDETPTDDAEKPTEDGDDETPGAPPEAIAYFEDFETIASQLYIDLADIANGIDGGTFDSDDAEIQANEDGLHDFGEKLETAILAISDLTPPEDVQDEHDDFIDSLIEYARVTADTLVQFDDVETVEDLDSLMDSAENGSRDAFIGYDDACRNVEDEGENAIEGYDVYCPSDDQQ